MDVNRLRCASFLLCVQFNDMMKYSRLREELGINVGKTDSEELAILTHHLQANVAASASSFMEEAGVYMRSMNGHVSKDSADVIQLKMDIEWDIPFPPPANPKFTFIDLFAGIGGFRLAMQSLGGKCVYSSEWDSQAKKTYEANFGEVPFGDITKQSNKDYIPESFDVLCAGFPCQAFSIAGKRGGFEDTRGTLFFDVAQILKKHRPKAFFLENVKGLTNHDKGKTLATILHTLREDLGYFVPEPKVLNAKDFGVPQNRERIFIVGFLDKKAADAFAYPEASDKTAVFEDVKEENAVSVKYYLSKRYLRTLEEHKARHESKGNGFGFAIIPDDGTANAVVVGGMGRERNLVYDDRLEDFTPVTHIKGEVNREGIRKMTPREWARLQGFPDTFEIPVADASAYKQFGNSVAVPAIRATATEIIKRVC